MDKKDSELKLPISSHLEELRKRFLYSLLFFTLATLIFYMYSPEIIAFLTQPLAELGVRRVIFTHLAEGFLVHVRAAIWVGFLVSIPFFLIQMWLFIVPGLYRNERKKILPGIVAVPCLFVAGLAFAYWVVMPLAWKFFLGFEQQDSLFPIQLEARLGEYLDLVFSIMCIFGLAFELPVLIYLLGSMGFVDPVYFLRYRRYVYLGAFGVAAIVTPPDILSQILLAGLLIVFYEMGLFALWLKRK
jgi:sec-independent protein translocase protein TatC